MNSVLPVCYPYVSGMLLVCICMYPNVVCTNVLVRVHGVQPGHLSVSDEANLSRRLTFLGVRHAFLPRIPSSCGAGTRLKPLIACVASVSVRFSGMKGQVGGFQNPGVCLQAFPSFLPHPSPLFYLRHLSRGL